MVLIIVSLIIYGLPFSRFATDIGLAEPYTQINRGGTRSWCIALYAKFALAFFFSSMRVGFSG